MGRVIKHGRPGVHIKEFTRGYLPKIEKTWDPKSKAYGSYKPYSGTAVNAYKGPKLTTRSVSHSCSNCSWCFYDSEYQESICISKDSPMGAQILSDPEISCKYWEG